MEIFCKGNSNMEGLHIWRKNSKYAAWGEILQPSSIFWSSVGDAQSSPRENLSSLVSLLLRVDLRISFLPSVDLRKLNSQRCQRSISLRIPSFITRVEVLTFFIHCLVFYRLSLPFLMVASMNLLLSLSPSSSAIEICSPRSSLRSSVNFSSSTPLLMRPHSILSRRTLKSAKAAFTDEWFEGGGEEEGKWDKFVNSIYTTEPNAVVCLPFEGIVEAMGPRDYNMSLSQFPLRRAMYEFTGTQNPGVCICQTKMQTRKTMYDLRLMSVLRNPVVVVCWERHLPLRWPTGPEFLVVRSTTEAKELTEMAYHHASEKRKKPQVVLLSDKVEEEEEVNIWFPIVEAIRDLKNGENAYIASAGFEYAFRKYYTQPRYCRDPVPTGILSSFVATPPICMAFTYSGTKQVLEGIKAHSNSPLLAILVEDKFKKFCDSVEVESPNRIMRIPHDLKDLRRTMVSAFSLAKIAKGPILLLFSEGNFD